MARAAPSGRRLGDVERVRRHAEADDFAEIAPRARAASSGSSTSMAAPSPRIRPRRSFENGRQVSGETTRMASHALRNPRLKTASLPPVMAMDAAPLRTIQKACPMA
jgi:hypothetical protein